MPFQRLLASQLRKPHGWLGSLLISRTMNRVNGQITRNTITALATEPEHNVLEIGFGGGEGIAILTNRLSSGVITGIDLSQDMVQKAQQRFRTEIAQDRVVVKQGDIAELPFPDAAFDRVFTVNTIYFWPDAAHGMSQLRRVLKDGGIAAIGLRSAEKMSQHSVSKYNFQLYSKEDVIRLMTQAGFRDVHSEHRDQDKWYDEVIVLGTR